eukprot:snap_masked-scaffold87_size395581-processed-gene-0.5 protein:Tk12232 transcript:snap_masked-scaffold87_size395581-processed-gene-0.5-mRNA-1 annotation:"abc transporter g family member 20-like"
MDTSNHRAAISIRNAYKHYGHGKNKLKVLNGLDMVVPKGVIYGLLGPSGCGKTTLLSCVIGQLHLNSGAMQVFQGGPGDQRSRIPGPRIGYMPQETALCRELTILETLQYFGRINQMDSASIKIRSLFLISLLELPSANQIVDNLSGGQKRRVSLAVALMHEPELLILDEPTVGVDPLLRGHIWRHLLKLSQDCQTTIVITTHYIEEARQANKVGMMRCGRILAEGSPHELMEEYAQGSLENVFLQVCLGHEELDASASKGCVIQKMDQTDSSEHEALKSSESAARQSKSRAIDWRPDLKWTRIWALLVKNAIKMWRRLGSVIFQLFIPTFQLALYCMAIGNPPHSLDVAMINLDVPGGACEYFPDTCVMGDEVQFIGGFNFNEAHRTNLSCRFLAEINPSVIHLKHFQSYESALASSASGQTWGTLHFHSNFSALFFDRLFALMELRSLDTEDLLASAIHVRLDMTNQQVGRTIQLELIEAFQRFVDQMIASCNMSSSLASMPLVFDEPIYGTEKQSLTDFAVPGIVLLITYFMALGLTALSFIVEQNEGILNRNWVAGVTPSELMLAHVGAQFSVMTVQTVLMLLYVIFVFQIPTTGSLALITILTILQGFCGMANGLLVSALSRSEEMGIYLCLATFFPNMTLSGIFWPLEGMPMWMQSIAWWLPQTYACEALRQIFFKGWGIEQVYVAFLVTTGWTGLFLVLAVVLFKLRR